MSTSTAPSAGNSVASGSSNPASGHPTPLQKGTPLIKQDPTERLAEKTCVVYLTAVKYQEPQKENDVWQQKAKVALGFRVGGCQETEKFRGIFLKFYVHPGEPRSVGAVGQHKEHTPVPEGLSLPGCNPPHQQAVFLNATTRKVTKVFDVNPEIGAHGITVKGIQYSKTVEVEEVTGSKVEFEVVPNGVTFELLIHNRRGAAIPAFYYIIIEVQNPVPGVAKPTPCFPFYFAIDKSSRMVERIAERLKKWRTGNDVEKNSNIIKADKFNDDAISKLESQPELGLTHALRMANLQYVRIEIHSGNNVLPSA